MKNPLPIGFGARLKELIAEGLPAKEAMKEAWREIKKSRAKTGVYSGSREIFGRKRRKNPKRNSVKFYHRTPKKRTRKNPIAIYNPSSELKKACQELVDHAQEQYPHFESPRGQRDIAKVMKALKISTARKNPIAIYNPPNQKLLYGRAYIPVIRGIKTSGKYKGERYQHNFSKSNEVSIYGNSDGSITVKSNNNIKLWDYDKDI